MRIPWRRDGARNPRTDMSDLLGLGGGSERGRERGRRRPVFFFWNEQVSGGQRPSLNLGGQRPSRRRYRSEGSAPGWGAT